MPTKTRFNGKNYSQLPRLVSDDIILNGLPQTDGAPDGYGSVADAVNALYSSQQANYWLAVTGDSWDPNNSRVSDMSMSSNSGKLGANLSAAEVSANAGFITTKDPVGGATDSVIRFPSIQYEYAEQESIIIFWKGQITPEGSDQVFFGDTSSSATQGIALRANANGTGTFYIGNPAGSLFGGSSSQVIFDGTTKSMCYALCGVTKRQLWYVNGNRVTQDPFTFSSGTVRNSRSIDTVNLGAGSLSPGGTAGIATKTQGLHVFKIGGAVNFATLNQIVEQLHRNPTQIIRSAF